MANPVLNDYVFGPNERSFGASSVMTATGAITKTIFLTGLLTVVAVFTGAEFLSSLEAGQSTIFGIPMMGAFFGGAIIGILAVLAAVFMPAIAMPASIVYAVVEGVVVGLITVFFGAEAQQLEPGAPAKEVAMTNLPIMAAALTLATLFGMLILYQLRIIKVNKMFRTIVVGATAGLFLGIAGLWLLSFFGFGGGLLATLYGSGPIGIGFSILCVGLAAFNLCLNFDFIERGSQGQLPKKYEWVAALGLLVTLVWLYIEMLRLLSKLRR